MNRSDFRCLDRLRVRWAEIDAQKIVFNAHYLMYFDTAIAGYWRALGLPYAAAMEQLGGDLYVRKATVEYLGSARYEDIIDIGVRCARIGTSSLRFEGGLWRQDRLLVTCELVYVFADPATQTSRPVPAALREVLARYEAGSAMLELRVDDTSATAQQATALWRDACDGDAVDEPHPSALHAIAVNRFGMVVGAGRLVPAAAGVARIERLATVQALRASGIGREVLASLLAAAQARGDREAMVASPPSVAPFFDAAGFVPSGEAGDANVEMACALG